MSTAAKKSLRTLYKGTKHWPRNSLQCTVCHSLDLFFLSAAGSTFDVLPLAAFMKLHEEIQTPIIICTHYLSVHTWATVAVMCYELFACVIMLCLFLLLNNSITLAPVVYYYREGEYIEKLVFSEFIDALFEFSSIRWPTFYYPKIYMSICFWHW